MRACNVDLAKLRSAVLASMPHWPYTQDQDEPDDALDPDEWDGTLDLDESDEGLNGDEGIPVEHFQIVLERAVDHAKSSGCEEVNSADVLVALLDRPVGELMNEHGVTRYDATTFICHGIGKDAQAASRGGRRELVGTPGFIRRRHGLIDVQGSARERRLYADGFRGAGADGDF
jgi:ATP-dependent Clp protease ATP-binding subunit ClpA